MRPFDATRLPTVVCGDNVTPSRIASKSKIPTTPPRSLSENSICALKLDRMDKVYGRKTLAIPPILSIQMLFSDRLLEGLSPIVCRPAKHRTGERNGDAASSSA